MSRLRQFAAVFRWPVIGVIAAVTIVLGVIGFLRQAELLGVDRTTIDATYRTIQLFVLEWGGEAFPMPATLEVARFAAPLVAGLAAAKAIAVVFRVELERLWVRLFGRNHVVVAGQGSTGWRLSAALREAGWRVAGIALTEPERPVSEWAIVVGDATERGTLLRAATHRARHLVTLCGDDATNIAVARAARLIGSDRLAIHVLTSTPELAALLRSESYRSHSDPSPTIEFFSLEERGAALLLDHVDMAPERMVLVGSSPIADRTVIEAVRRWPEVSVERVGFAEAPSAGPSLLGIRSLVLVADDVSRRGLTIALRFVQHLKEIGFGAAGGTCDVFALSREAQNLSDLVAPTHGPDSAIRLHAFDLREMVFTAGLVEGGTREAIARALHDAYRQTVARDVDTLPAWEELTEEERDASREAADGIGALFREIGCDLVAATPDGDPPIALLPSEAELMAMLEHDRWLAWLASRGESRSHRLATDWFDLPEDARHRTEAVMRRLPKVLHDIGQRVVRLDRSPARDLHAAYVERHTARGETPADNPSLVPWDRLSESLQDSNRDQVAHLRVKLRAIGLDLIEGPGPEIVLTPEQVEALSEMEHDRWVRHRRSDGWTQGEAKDTDRKITPYLVPWNELDERTKETDREFVRTIPDLAAALGAHIGPYRKQSERSVVRDP